jgi:hypothetical protein
MTTQPQINEAKQIAAEIEAATGFETKVDDWSDYGSFRVFQFPTSRTDNTFFFRFLPPTNLRSIGWAIKRVLKKHPRTILESLVMPKEKYEQYLYRLYSMGYDNAFIQIDFRVLQVEEPKEQPKEVQLML